MIFEIINPSDKCYIEGDDFKTVCIATILLSEGGFGLQEVDGERTMPPLIFAESWFVDTFGQDFGTAINEASKSELASILSTVSLVEECTSLNDIVGKAKYYAEQLMNTSTEEPGT